MFMDFMGIVKIIENLSKIKDKGVWKIVDI